MVSEWEEKTTSGALSDTKIDEDKTKGYGTTRHGTHLTKTSEDLAESENVEGKKLKQKQIIFLPFRSFN